MSVPIHSPHPIPLGNIQTWVNIKNKTLTLGTLGNIQRSRSCKNLKVLIFNAIEAGYDEMQ